MVETKPWDSAHQVNVTSPAFLQPLHEEWRDIKLDPQRKKTYDAQAEVEMPKDTPKAHRKGQRSAAIAPPQTAAPVLPAPANDSQKFVPIEATGRYDVDGASVLSRLPLSFADARHLKSVAPPVSTQAISLCLSKSSNDGKSYKAIASDFVSLANSYAGNAGGVAPSAPREPRWTPTPPRAETARPALEKMLVEFVKKSLGAWKMREMNFAKVLLRCTGMGTQRWLEAVSANDSAGQVPLRVNFFECKPAGEEDAANDLPALVYVLEDFVPSKSRLPCARGCPQVGRVRHYTHWDVAALLLGDWAAKPLKTEQPITVTLAKFHYEETTGRFLVTGLDSAVPSVARVFTPAAKKRAAGHFAGAGAAGVDDVDWDHGVLPPRPRPATQPQAPTTCPRMLGPPPGLSEEALQGLIHGGPSDYGILSAGEEGDRELAGSDSESSLTDDPEEGDGAGPSTPSGPSSSGTSCAATDAQRREAAHAICEVCAPQQLEGMRERWPRFALDDRWEVNDGTRVLGNIRPVDGVLLKTSCRLHGSACTPMFIRFSTRFEHAQCLAVRWLIFGTTCDAASHKEARLSFLRRWNGHL